MYRSMRHATLDMMTILTSDIILIPMVGTGNVACVSLTLNVTTINWATVTHPRQYLLMD